MAGEIPRLKIALDRTLRDLGLDKRLKTEQVSVWWTQIVGPVVATIASPVQMRGGTLFVDVGDHLWMQELKFQEPELRDRLNQAIGEPLVRRLFFQLARMPSTPRDHPTEAVSSPVSAVPLDRQQEEALEREVANVRDPQLREALKGFRRRLLQARPSL